MPVIGDGACCRRPGRLWKALSERPFERSTRPSSRPTTSAASTPTRWTRTWPTASAAPSPRVLVELEGKPVNELRIGARARHAPAAPAMAERYAEGMQDEGASVHRRGPGRHRDALFPVGVARPRRRADVHRLPQPEGVHGREARPRGALRCRATRASASCANRDGRRARASRPPSAASSTEEDVAPGFREATVASSTRLGAADEGGARRRQRHGRPDGRARCSTAADRAGADLLDARRQVPRPRAEPAAAREPQLHRQEGRCRRARSWASPGTATPTAASSSTTRASSWTATSSPRCSPSRSSPRIPGRTILYDVRASRAVNDVVERAGGQAERQPRRPRVLQDAHAPGGRCLRRRGLGPLLLPRLLLRRFGHNPCAADPRAPVGEGKRMSELLAPLREHYFISGEINSEVSTRTGR